MITEAFNTKNDMSLGERVLSFGLGLFLVPAHWVDQKLKDNGLDSDGELEEWQIRTPQ